MLNALISTVIVLLPSPFSALQYSILILQKVKGLDFFLSILKKIMRFTFNTPFSVGGRWYEDNEPESIAIPDYENRILEQVKQLFTQPYMHYFDN